MLNGLRCHPSSRFKVSPLNPFAQGERKALTPPCTVITGNKSLYRRSVPVTTISISRLLHREQTNRSFQ
jgi:hypothetical protein